VRILTASVTVRGSLEELIVNRREKCKSKKRYLYPRSKDCNRVDYRMKATMPTITFRDQFTAIHIISQGKGPQWI
jgi:hypothetical protein